ncbi:MAG: Protoporphyrinogen IX oxidase, aerobic, HemY [uncultured Thermomicrobiales bacterium]|uniref:Coproporphyrinogen III oxidase n=1 Tax=uncultured Thermomicrobiales bacterium TaxID=1645740 RepID=A0A6J4VJM6_9BACT|nr:MAG: Protoporphyrinogen IX oxidase, aerobic, HemY [uncultured Thermomicrobiales bacterium]
MTPGPTTAPRIVIVGGGITGLAAARAVALTAPEVDVTVLEAADRLGGKIVTVQEDGFTVEGGPESYLAAKGWMTDLCAEIGLADGLQPTRPENRGSRVLWDGRLHPIPDGLSGLVPTRLRPVVTSSLLSPIGKARMALDWVLPARTDADDESLERFISRRLGREAYQRLIEPLMAGIYAGDGGQLSTMATFPQLRGAERDHGGIIRGVIANRRRALASGAAPKAGFLSPVGGMGDIVDALTTCLLARGVTLRTGIAVTRLARAPEGSPHRYLVQTSSGEDVAADGLILATPAPVTADLLSDGQRGLSPIAGANLRHIPHVNSVTLSLAFRRQDIAHPLRGYGYVVPRVQRRPVLASTWTSSKWARRAPDDQILLRFYVGRSGGRDALTLSDDEIQALALAELRDVLGVDAVPTRRWVFRWPDGSPQYTVGHLDRIAEVDLRIAMVPGLAIAGCGYHGVGIPDCVRSGERAARRVVEQVLALATDRPS